MNSKRQRTFFWLSRIAVLFIYIPFFAVQCFFNYSSITQAKSETFQTYQKENAKRLLSIAADAEKKSPGKQVTVNLNKRFQPGSISYLLHIAFELQVYFFKANFFTRYSNALLPTSPLYTGALRGPPAVV